MSLEVYKTQALLT